MHRILKKPSLNSAFRIMKLVLNSEKHRELILRFIAETNQGLLLKFKTNPCTVECICSNWLRPVFDDAYITRMNSTYSTNKSKLETLHAETSKQIEQYGLPPGLSLKGLQQKGIDVELAAKVMNRFVGKEDMSWYRDAPGSFLIQKRREAVGVPFDTKRLVCEMKVSYFVGVCNTWYLSRPF